MPSRPSPGPASRSSASTRSPCLTLAPVWALGAATRGCSAKDASSSARGTCGGVGGERGRRGRPPVAVPPAELVAHALQPRPRQPVEGAERVGLEVRYHVVDEREGRGGVGRVERALVEPGPAARPGRHARPHVGADVGEHAHVLLGEAGVGPARGVGDDPHRAHAPARAAAARHGADGRLPGGPPAHRPRGGGTHEEVVNLDLARDPAEGAPIRLTSRRGARAPRSARWSRSYPGRARARPRRRPSSSRRRAGTRGTTSAAATATPASGSRR